MAFLLRPPESSFGWVLWSVGIMIQVLAVATVVRDTRGRRVTGWDGLAVAFVILLGPAAAAMFLGAHGFLDGRERRRQQRARERAAVAQAIRSANETTMPSGPRT